MNYVHPFGVDLVLKKVTGYGKSRENDIIEVVVHCIIHCRHVAIVFMWCVVKGLRDAK